MLCMQGGAEGSLRCLLAVPGSQSAAALCMSRTKRANPQRGSDLAVWFPFTESDCTLSSSHVLKASIQNTFCANQVGQITLFSSSLQVSFLYHDILDHMLVPPPDWWLIFLTLSIIQPLSLHANLPSFLPPANCKCEPCVLLVAASVLLSLEVHRRTWQNLKIAHDFQADPPKQQQKGKTEAKTKHFSCEQRLLSHVVWKEETRKRGIW